MRMDIINQSQEEGIQNRLVQSKQPVSSIPDICHGSHGYIRGEKICHVEKFQISVHDRCGEI